MKPIKKLSLCPDCSECPAVEVYEERVRIGEDENVVNLTRPQWNELVARIRGGELDVLR